MDKCGSVFQSSDCQFGFKPAHSTTQCSFVVEEIIEFYNNNGSSVFLATLDASRAFDRVEYCKLFEILITRDMCPMYIRLLLYMYTHQKLRVKWNGIYGNMFNVSNGVKQGGILSPLLFCIYIDILLCALKQSNIGCTIGNVFMGCVGYADDVCLLAPSCHALRHMLSICEEFGIQYYVKFNSTKSHITVCNRNVNITVSGNFILNGEIIETSNYVEHLGHVIGNSASKRKVIEKAIGDLYMRTNYVMSKFGCCSSDVRNFLFRTYCTSYYGSALWNLSAAYIERFYVAWRKCVRRVWGVPSQTHCVLLPCLYGDSGINLQLLRRFASFYYGLKNSDNKLVHLCAKFCEVSQSTVGLNRKALLYRINNNGDVFNESIGCIRKSIDALDNVSIMDFNCGMVVKELCMVRDKVLHIELDSSGTIELLTELCIN